MEIIQGLSEKARSDLHLVEQAKLGSEKAFATLMYRYRDSIYYMLLKMVNNPADAEDLTIEAFGKAFSNSAHGSSKLPQTIVLTSSGRSRSLPHLLTICRIAWKMLP